MKPWLLVTGDFVKTGGMDVANHALARYLARHGHEVHLVAHRVDEDLLQFENVKFHPARKPMDSYYLGRRRIDRLGRTWAEKLADRGAHVVVNGGNCIWGDINWVHYVHAAYRPDLAGSLIRRMVHGWKRRAFLAEERKALSISKMVVVASHRTRGDLIECVDVPAGKIRTVYYGVDDQQVHPASAAERAATRARLNWANDSMVALFVGALGDRRKGFDTVFDAWTILKKNGTFDCRLAVAGRGAEVQAWKERVDHAGLTSQIEFLGFRNDVPQIVRAVDVLVAPARYEPYGLSVHEALCSGVPAIASACSGVSEKYTAELRDLLIEDENDPVELADRIMKWHSQRQRYRGLMLGVSQHLRQWTWDRMAEEFVRLVQNPAGASVMKMTA